jgi:hypothetical protein
MFVRPMLHMYPPVFQNFHTSLTPRFYFCSLWCGAICWTYKYVHITYLCSGIYWANWAGANLRRSTWNWSDQYVNSYKFRAFAFFPIYFLHLEGKYSIVKNCLAHPLALRLLHSSISICSWWLFLMWLNQTRIGWIMPVLPATWKILKIYKRNSKKNR